MKEYKGKYGYYYCSKETYLKIKRLHKEYWSDLRKLACYNRWIRKLEKNRIGSMPEKNCTFTIKNPLYKHWNSDLAKGQHALSDLGIIELYRKSKYPLTENINTISDKEIIFTEELFSKIPTTVT